MASLIPGLERSVPIPEEWAKPFFDAANQKKLVVQQCQGCHTRHYPPKQKCDKCNSTAPLSWVEVKGRGHIDVYFVVRDSRIRGFRSAQPINFAIITLDDDPGLNFLSNLPGTPAGQVPVGAPVEVVFDESVDPKQLVPEWRVVK